MVFQALALKKPSVYMTIRALAALFHHQLGVHKLQQTPLMTYMSHCAAYDQTSLTAGSILLQIQQQCMQQC